MSANTTYGPTVLACGTREANSAALLRARIVSTRTLRAPDVALQLCLPRPLVGGHLQSATYGASSSFSKASSRRLRGNRSRFTERCILQTPAAEQMADQKIVPTIQTHNSSSLKGLSLIRQLARMRAADQALYRAKAGGRNRIAS